MKPPLRAVAALVFWALAFVPRGIGQTGPVAALPPGVTAVWDIGHAFRERTATKEKICINGLWRWQPATSANAGENVPDSAWGFFKVPGSWPRITDYMQKDSQTVFAHESWKDRRLRDLDAAWYQREISIPPIAATLKSLLTTRLKFNWFLTT